MPLKSTTRHIQIYAAVIEEQNDELIDSENMLTIDVDPDNELNWTDALCKRYIASLMIWSQNIKVLICLITICGELVRI